jgi:hypothetical protein
VFDPRCHAPGRFIGTALPPGVETWLRALGKNSTAEIMARYPGLVSPKRAAALKTRAEEYLEGGYEFALLREFSRAKMMDCKEDDDAWFAGGKKRPGGWKKKNRRKRKRLRLAVPVQVAPERALLLAEPLRELQRRAHEGRAGCRVDGRSRGRSARDIPGEPAGAGVPPAVPATGRGPGAEEEDPSRVRLD